MFDRVAENFCDVGRLLWRISRCVNDGIETYSFERGQIAVAIATEFFYRWKELWILPSAIE